MAAQILEELEMTEPEVTERRFTESIVTESEVLEPGVTEPSLEAQLEEQPNEALSTSNLPSISTNPFGEGVDPVALMPNFQSYDDAHRIEALRRFLEMNDFDDFMAQFDVEALPPPIIGECQIHFEETFLEKPTCCQFEVCSECTLTYVRLHVMEGNVKIPCINPECKTLMSRFDIRHKLDDSLKLKFDQFLVDANRDPHRKTCPRCSNITSDEAIMPAASKDVKRVKKYGLQVACEECHLVWCFSCQAPWHANITCQDYRKGDKLVKLWAKEHQDNQVNAHKCPKCKVLIQRSTGCDHMQCTQCGTDFCYRCGEKRKVLKPFQLLLGKHDGRLGVASCKYSYMPDDPVRRRLARGAILCAKLAAIPVAAGLAAAALPIAVIALPIGFSVVKIRQAIRARRINQSRTSSESRSFDQEIERQLELIRIQSTATNEATAGTEPFDLFRDYNVEPVETLQADIRRIGLEIEMAEVGDPFTRQRMEMLHIRDYLQSRGNYDLSVVSRHLVLQHEIIEARNASRALESADEYSTDSAPPTADAPVGVTTAAPFDDSRAIVVV